MQFKDKVVIMKELKERILKYGKIGESNVLKVDFLNHIVDTQLLYEMGKELSSIFKNCYPSKILTIEASGIAIAASCALELRLPFVIAKKDYSINSPTDVYKTEIYSYTKEKIYNVYVSKNAITPKDRILIIDDFLANGCAVKGLIEIIAKAESTLVGIGICIEKSFQQGLLNPEEQNLNSLVKIKSLDDGVITFAS
jgi:xanthine phosphoribosyltransferase